jgi:hypothetical protein
MGLILLVLFPGAQHSKFFTGLVGFGSVFLGSLRQLFLSAVASFSWCLSVFQFSLFWNCFLHSPGFLALILLGFPVLSKFFGSVQCGPVFLGGSVLFQGFFGSVILGRFSFVAWFLGPAGLDLFGLFFFFFFFPSFPGPGPEGSWFSGF